MNTLNTPQRLAYESLWIQSVQATVQAGFASPAEDHQVDRIDLMRQLVKHPQATFFIRISGDSMRDAGILNGSVVLCQGELNFPHLRELNFPHPGYASACSGRTRPAFSFSFKR